MDNINTLGALNATGYKSKSIKEEMRDNLILKMQKGEERFPGIVGYEDTVIPDTERAILSRHNMLVSWFARPGQNQDGQADDRFAG
jgi:magnesium chelatase subunit I